MDPGLDLARLGDGPNLGMVKVMDLAPQGIAGMHQARVMRELDFASVGVRKGLERWQLAF